MENSTEHVIEINGVTKVFRDFWRRPKARAVDELCLSVRRGEIFGLLGPNGSGKSTTLKLMLGLLFPDKGDISILGSSPGDLRVKQKIGYLPEDSHLHKYLTAEEALSFYGRLFAIGKRDLAERTAELIAMVGLEDAANRPISEFSKGMARRMGLAQALINDPEIIILDEPTSGLDPIGGRQAKALLQKLRDMGKTVILSSHLLADVEDVCDHICILYAGRQRAYGRVDHLLEERSTTRINVPRLDPEELQTVLKTLRKKVGGEPAVDHPSINLEDFFIRVIEDAHINREGRSPAVPDRIASFLGKGA